MATSWEHLLGGYATNTLTDEEKQQLFKAALQDQILFDALADEEALKSMLADPEARQRILASLQATEHPGGVTRERGGWGWVRQPSHLAWAGSLVALGLVLIFGWQMEKEWGPVISQEQEARSSSSRDEVVFQAQKHSEEGKAPVRKEALERKAAQTEGIEAETQSISEPASQVEANEVDRLRQNPAVAKKESDAREKSQAMRRQRANEQVGHAPSIPSASDQPKDGRTVQSLAVPEASEEAMADKVPQATAPGRFADQAEGEASVSPPSAQELFYAASASLGDELIPSRKDTDRHTPGETLRLEVKPSVKGKRSAEVVEQAPVSESISHSAMGIRYSFVRQTKDGEDEEVENRQITGNWSQIRLAVESNVSGYLYVLASLGNGKWQKLLPIDTAKTVKTEGWINVQSFQRVEFPLGQLTNALGKPVVSSITVLLSPEPLDDLGQWLGNNVDTDGHLIERIDDAVFVVQIEPGQEVPLLLDIPLGD